MPVKSTAWAMAAILVALLAGLAGCSVADVQEPGLEEPLPDEEMGTVPSTQKMGTVPLASPPGAEGRRASQTQRAVPSEMVDGYAIIISIDPKDRSRSRRANLGSNGEIPMLLKRSAGIPEDHVLHLRQADATRAAIEEAVLTWLTDRIDEESIVLLYVSAPTMADPQSGEVFLIPSDGTRVSARGELLSLHALQGTLKRMNARICLLFLEPSVLESPWLSRPNRARPPELDWRGFIEPAEDDRVVRLIQVVSTTRRGTGGGGLLAGLAGSADRNKDGRITVGELLDGYKDKATVYPTLPLTAPEREIPLTVTR